VRGGQESGSNVCPIPLRASEMDRMKTPAHIVRRRRADDGFVGSATSPSPRTEDRSGRDIKRMHTPQIGPSRRWSSNAHEQVRLWMGRSRMSTAKSRDRQRHSRLKVAVTISGVRASGVDFAASKLGQNAHSREKTSD